jgi:hypothetical protein
MSYLNSLRLHFAGRFQANVSTVNNDPAHFHNAAFQPGYQQMQGANMSPPNGWFNPQGDAAWRLLGCRITSAWTSGGAVKENDPVMNYIIADSDRHAPAKLADLDSEQQLVSEIWGLQVRIADAKGNTLMRGDFDPAAFADIWDRATGKGGGDNAAGAMYQSVLTNLQWADVSSSAFLTELQQVASDGLLSIKFNVDGFNLSFTSPDFMTGRITGTIGPATVSEPRHLLVGRQFMASPGKGGNFFTPAGGINFLAAVVDTAASCIYLDLGNALSTSIAGGAFNDLGDLTLSAYDPILTPANPGGSTIPLGVIPSKGPGGYSQDTNWYPLTAGIVVLPLNEEQLKWASVTSLMLTGDKEILIKEWSSAAFVRADRYVYRLSPGEPAELEAYAMQWGRPLAGVEINFLTDNSQLQGQVGDGFPYVAASPAIGTPASALSYQTTAFTDKNGRAAIQINTSDPGTPRYFSNGADFGIDGQVYGIRPGFVDAAQYDGPINQWNFISILLWSGFHPPSPITWTSLQPIFQQYANLYPVMNRFLNLGNYDDVVANADLLTLAFGVSLDNPNSMPVTRDLSPAKRDAILTWLKNPLPGPIAPVNTLTIAAQATTKADPSLVAAASSGGKSAAAARRIVLKNR